jgi:DNA-directed RNA polymerase specialized sigma24 family protein
LQSLGEPPDQATLAIEQVIAELPVRTWVAAELRLRHQCSRSAIAAELAVTAGTVERCVRRATVALKKGLPQRLE